MKKRNRFFALILVLVTVFATLPITAFAAEPWIEFDGESETVGTTTTSTINVSVDAAVLADLLRTEGISKELLSSLKSGIRLDRDFLTSVLTPAEIFEIIPRDEWMDVLQIDAAFLKSLNLPIDKETLAQLGITKEMLKELDFDVEWLKSLNISKELLQNLGINKEWLKNIGFDSAWLSSITVQPEWFSDITLDPDMLREIDIEYAWLEEIGVDVEWIKELGVEKDWFLALNLNSVFSRIGTDKIRSYLDLDALIQLADPDALKALLDEVDDLSAIVDADEVINRVGTDLLLEHMDLDAIRNTLNIGDIIDRLLTDLQAEGGDVKTKLLNIVRLQKVLDDRIVDVEPLILTDRLDELNTSILLRHITFPSIGVDNISVIDELKALLGDKPIADYVSVSHSVDRHAIAEAIHSDVLFGDALATPGGTVWVDRDGILAAYPGTTSETLESLDSAAVAPFIHVNICTDLNRTDLIENDLTALRNLLGADLTAFVTADATLQTAKMVQDVGIDNLIGDSLFSVDVVGIALDDEVDATAVVDVNRSISAVKTAFSTMSSAQLEQYIDKSAALAMLSGSAAVELMGGYSAAKSFLDLSGLFSDTSFDRTKLLQVVDLTALVEQVGAGRLLDVVSVNDVMNMLDENELKEILDVLTSSDLHLILAQMDDAYLTKLVGKLTPAQLQTLIGKLSEADLKKVANSLTTADLNKIIDRMTEADLNAIFNKLTTADLNRIMNLLTDTDISAMIDGLSATDIQNIVAQLDTAAITKILDMLDSTQLAQLLATLSNSDLLAIIRKLDLRANAKPVAVMVLNRVLKNVDYIKVNGVLVADEDEYGLLRIHSDKLVETLKSLKPSLNDISTTTDGNLYTVNLAFGYTPNGTDVQKDKSITANIYLEGDLAAVRNAAAQLSDLLNRYCRISLRDDSTLVVDVTIPATFAKLTNRVLDSDKLSEANKQKLVGLFTETGSDAFGFVDGLQMSDLADLLDSVSPTQLYEYLMRISYVESVIDRMSSVSGYDLSAITPDNVLDYVVKTIDFAEKVPGYDRICTMVANKTGYSVASLENLLSRHDLDSLYETALNKAKSGVGAYNKVKNYVLAVEKYLPDVLLNTNVSDLYQGNGNFHAQKAVSFDAKDAVRKILNKTLSVLKLNLDISDLETLMVQVTNTNITIGVDATVHFNQMYRVSYMDAYGTTELYKAFLPVGADLGIFKNPLTVAGERTLGWLDADGNAIAVLPAADTVVYAEQYVAPSFTITFTDPTGGTLGAYTTSVVGRLSATDLADLQVAVDAYAEANKPARTVGYTVEWYLWDATAGKGDKVDDLTAYAFTADTTLRAEITYELQATVTFENPDGASIGTLYINKGESFKAADLAIIEAAIATYVEANQPTGTVAYTVEWYLWDAVTGKGDKVDDLTAYVFTADTTLRAEITYDVRVAVTFQHPDGSVMKVINLKQFESISIADSTVILDTISEYADANEPAGTVGYMIEWYLWDDITGWGDKMVDFTTYTFASDTTLRAKITYDVRVAVTFRFPNGNVIDIFDLNQNASISAYGVTAIEEAIVAYAEANKPTGTVGYVIEWYLWDAVTGEGAKVDDISTYTFASDATLRAKITYDVHVAVTILLPDGTSISVLDLKQNDLISSDDLATAIKAVDDYAKAQGKGLYASYSFEWHLYQDGVIGAKIDDLSTYSFAADASVIAVVIPDEYYISMTGGNFALSVSVDSEAHRYDYVLTGTEIDLNAGIRITIDKARIAGILSSGNTISLQVKINDPTLGTYTLFHITDRTMTDLLNRAGGEISYTFRSPASGVPAAFIGTPYENVAENNSVFYEFGAEVDGTPYHGLFADAIVVEVPYNSVADGILRKTLVHVKEEDSVIAPVDILAGAAAGTVRFAAPHFSDYVVADEYSLTASFISSVASDPNVISGILEGLDLTVPYFPAGQKLTITPVFDGTYTWAETRYTAGTETGTIGYGAVFTMPASDVALTLVASPKQFFIYYYVNGSLYATQPYYTFDSAVGLIHLDDAAVQNAHPAGYTAQYVWSGFDVSKIGFANMNVFAKWTPVVYTVNFVDASGKILFTTTYTVENAEYEIPAVPVVAGKIGTWAFGTPDETNTLTVTATYTDQTFRISTDGNAKAPTAAMPGETVKFTVNSKAGYTNSVTVTALYNGTIVTVTDGSFVMPASNVYISVCYHAKTVNYTINGTAGTGLHGDTVTFDIVVPVGKYLAEAPANCTLADYRRESGMLALTYAFTLKDGAPMEITYRLDDSIGVINKILNGSLYSGAGDPTAEHDDVLFAGWSEATAGGFSFATFRLQEEEESLLWLWILLIVLAVIILIAVLYVLYIKGVWKTNFILRFVVFLVNIFFAICLAVAAVGIAIARLFGYREETEEKAETKEKK